MRLPHQVGSVLFLLLGLLALQQALTLEYTSPGTGAGPGVLPVWTSIAILIVSVGMFVNSTRTESSILPPGTIPDRQALTTVVLAFIGLIAVIVFIQGLGFRLTMFAFFLWVLIVVGRWSWWKSLLFATIGSLFLFWLFSGQLMVPLPISPFGI